jgi:large subunit ribosomal protein L29
MKIAEIRNLNATELKTKEGELREEGLNLRLQQQTGRLEKPSRLNDIRKDIAKIETVLSEQRLGLKPAKKA